MQGPQKIALISGWFAQWGRIGLEMNQDGLGVVVLNGADEYHGVLAFSDESNFSGGMSDRYGKSRITDGKLEGGRLTFKKQYVHRQDIIEYSFTQGGDSLFFVGGYSGSATGDDLSKCMLVFPPPAFFEK